MQVSRGTSPRKHVQKLITTSDAVTKFFLMLPGLGAIFITITSVGYFVGWNMLRSYYTEVGTEWYPKSLPASISFQEASPILVLMTLSFVIGIGALMRGIKTETVTLCTAGTALFASVLLVVISFCEDIFGVKATYYIASASGYIFAVSGGGCLAEIIARLKDSKLKWGATHISVLLSFYSYGLVHAPTLMQQYKAKYDMNPVTSELSYVQKVGCDSCIWRLVSIVENKALLSRISSEKSHRVFQLISLDENWIIEQHNSR